MRSVTIESCTEGFLVWNLDENGLKTKEQYAVSQDKLIQKVKELLGITDRKKNPIPSTEFDITHHISKLGKELEDIITNATKPIPAPFVFKEIDAFEVSVQPTTKGKTTYWLHPGGKKIRISRLAYKSVFIHANISDLVYLYEHPAEQKELVTAYGKATYENKAVILRGFLKDVPLSALVGDNYYDEVVTQNGVLMELSKSSEPKGQEDGSCDDVAFESCANNSPEQCRYCIDQSRYENKNKLAAKKPASPLMKASVPP